MVFEPALPARATGTLRVSAAGEIEGLDLHEHGMLAYPEYVIHGYAPSPNARQGAETLVAVKQPEPLRAR